MTVYDKMKNEQCSFDMTMIGHFGCFQLFSVFIALKGFSGSHLQFLHMYR